MRSWPLNELVKLTMLWTTGPWTLWLPVQWDDNIVCQKMLHVARQCPAGKSADVAAKGDCNWVEDLIPVPDCCHIALYNNHGDFTQCAMPPQTIMKPPPNLSCPWSVPCRYTGHQPSRRQRVKQESSLKKDSSPLPQLKLPGCMGY